MIIKMAEIGIPVEKQHHEVATAGHTRTALPPHQSLFKTGEPLMYDKNGYAGTSDLCRWYIGGLLKHAGAILAFAAPTTNSSKRPAPRYERPANLAYSR